MNPYRTQNNPLQIRYYNISCIFTPNVYQDSCKCRSLNAGAIGDSPVEELRRYKTLVDDGILTEEEYAAKKKQILGI